MHGPPPKKTKTMGLFELPSAASSICFEPGASSKHPGRPWAGANGPTLEPLKGPCGANTRISGVEPFATCPPRLSSSPRKFPNRTASRPDKGPPDLSPPPAGRLLQGSSHLSQTKEITTTDDCMKNISYLGILERRSRAVRVAYSGAGLCLLSSSMSIYCLVV